MDETKEYKQTFASKYQILEQIGQGGMGKIFKAVDIGLNRIVALKVMLKNSLADKELNRFQQEAQATARLKHPNIVSVHDSGEYLGQYFFTMDFIEGATLADILLQKKKKVQPRWIAEIMVKVLDAIQYAHTQGIIHRDLKPGNIMIDKNGEPYILDFGLAKLKNSENRITKTGVIMGTLVYMSPEQAGGYWREIDEQSDIYSMGIILYEALSGVLPFRGLTQHEILTRMLESLPKRPKSYNRKIPDDLESICLKAIEKEKKDRYSSAKDFAEDLRRYLDGKPILARPPSWKSHVSKSLKKNARLLIVNSLVILVMAAVIWALAFQKRSYSQPEKNSKPIDNKTPPKQTPVETPKPRAKFVLAEAICDQKGTILNNMQVTRYENIQINPDVFFVFYQNINSVMEVTFFLPEVPEKISLRLFHVTSTKGGPWNPGFSPIHIMINGKIFKKHHDAGSGQGITEEFPIQHFLVKGKNTILLQLAENAETVYWLKYIQIVVE